MSRCCGQTDCISNCSQTYDWEVNAKRVRWISLPGKGNKSCWFAWIFVRRKLDLGFTQHNLLFSLEFDSSAGKFVTAMISPPRQHSSCSSKVLSASAAIANSLYRARMPWILEHPCDSWLWNVLKIEALAAQSRTSWTLAFFVFLDLHAENERYFWLGMKTAGICTENHESVLGQANVAL